MQAIIIQISMRKKSSRLFTKKSLKLKETYKEFSKSEEEKSYNNNHEIPGFDLKQPKFLL